MHRSYDMTSRACAASSEKQETTLLQTTKNNVGSGKRREYHRRRQHRHKGLPRCTDERVVKSGVSIHRALKLERDGATYIKRCIARRSGRMVNGRVSRAGALATQIRRGRGADARHDRTNLECTVGPSDTP
jgi:hypothetical protein